MLAIVERLNRQSIGKRILILTYSSSLKTETRKRAASAGLSVDVHSFHSLYSIIIDLQLMVAIENPLDIIYDVVIVDEAQDLSPLYFYTHKSVAGRTTQKIMVSDSLQTINQYRGATDTCFRQPELYFNTPFTKLVLSTSFRAPLGVCSFINTTTRSPNVIGGSPGSSVKETEYIVYGDETYPEIDLYRDIKLVIANALRTGKSVFVLAPSVRNKSYRSVYNGSGRHTQHSFRHNSPRPSPISSFITYLVKSLDFRFPIDLPSDDMTVRNEDSDDDDDVSIDSDATMDLDTPPLIATEQRVVFKTYHESKGLEADLVICFGYDMSYFSFYARDADPRVVPNTHHVGLTRTKGRMILLHNSDSAPPRPKFITQICQLFNEDIDIAIAQFKAISLLGVVKGPRRINLSQLDVVDTNNTRENVSAIKDMAIMLMLDTVYATRAHSMKSKMSMGNVISVILNSTANSAMNRKWREAWDLIRPRVGPIRDMSLSRKAFVCALVLSSHSVIYAHQIPIVDKFVTHVGWKKIRTFFETFGLAFPQFNFPIKHEVNRCVVKVMVPVIDHSKFIAVNLYVRGDVTKERIIESTIMNDVLVGCGYAKYTVYTACLESQEYYKPDGMTSNFFEHLKTRNTLDATLNDPQPKTSNAIPIAIHLTDIPVSEHVPVPVPAFPATFPPGTDVSLSTSRAFDIGCNNQTVYKTTDGRTPDHVALRRRCDDSRKNSTKRWSNKEIAAMARRQYYYQLVMGKPPTSDRDKARHDSFNRCFEPTPIRLCAMIVTNTYMFTLLDYRTDGCLCPVCPGGQKFTTSHFACIQQLIQCILVGPKLPLIGPDLLQQLQERHDFHGIWTLHEHLESFLQHVEQPMYPHPSLTYQQMFPIPRLITLLKYYFQNSVQTNSSRLLVPPMILPIQTNQHIPSASVVWCGIGSPPTSLLNRIMTDNLVLLGISYSALTHSTALHDKYPIRTTEVGTLFSRSEGEYVAQSIVSVFCQHQPELTRRISSIVDSLGPGFNREFTDHIFLSIFPEPLQRL
ncbi:hypothetical protein SARC_07390 [Sphaeroforma arctica JP610]|uniref:UvrD-like helicase ATP-binding domain-containing protein n=1 Tax=Sphaeroforma arctica JP610 TaxID=667725 RepID=A0A0L0FTV2_9EUKA|nr:hypothetical protein SARC_07390 [Sphaeroforma arctica JP610]KNC80252.1 hypothetical protein SARC_07390 [Sphaeroforma arctica JP610]|eukprot:XP_014154154.1 hypothetical protein SARC_07390 [Sphaeroforma arctica JP610]